MAARVGLWDSALSPAELVESAEALQGQLDTKSRASIEELRKFVRDSKTIEPEDATLLPSADTEQNQSISVSSLDSTQRLIAAEPLDRRSPDGGNIMTAAWSRFSKSCKGNLVIYRGAISVNCFLRDQLRTGFIL